MRTFKLRSLAASCSFLLILIGGCAFYQPDAAQGTEAYRQSMRVLVQICMPGEFTQTALSISQVNRYGDRGEMRSIGRGVDRRIGMSASGEPVFERFTHRRQVDLVAIIVDVGQTAYTYDFTKAKMTPEGWTKWDAAMSQNNQEEMVWHRLAHEKNYKVTVPGRESPKARYRLTRTVIPPQKERV